LDQKIPSGFQPDLYDMILSLSGNSFIREHDLRVYFHVRLSDLTTDSPLSTAPKDELRRKHCFPFLICHGADVILTGSPMLIDAVDFRACGDLTFYNLLTLLPSRQWDLDAVLEHLRRWLRERPRAFWQYAPRLIDPGDLPMLADLKLVFQLDYWPDDSYFSSFCGMRRGLADCLQMEGDNVLSPCITTDAWLELWEPLEDNAPFPLEQLLRGLKEGRIPDPDYYTAALERLMNMPMSVFLSGLTDGLDILEEKLGDTSLSYLETARWVAEQLQHEDQADSANSVIVSCLSRPFRTCYGFRMREKESKEKRGRWKW